jgi:hypothetical protein
MLGLAQHILNTELLLRKVLAHGLKLTAQSEISHDSVLAAAELISGQVGTRVT